MFVTRNVLREIDVREVLKCSSKHSDNNIVTTITKMTHRVPESSSLINLLAQHNKMPGLYSLFNNFGSMCHSAELKLNHCTALLLLILAGLETIMKSHTIFKSAYSPPDNYSQPSIPETCPQLSAHRFSDRNYTREEIQTLECQQ